MADIDELKAAVKKLRDAKIDRTAAASPTASAALGVPASNLCGKTFQVLSVSCTHSIISPPN